MSSKIAKEFDKKTPSIKNLPERVKNKKTNKKPMKSKKRGY
jgi:hypothetical protein